MILSRTYHGWSAVSQSSSRSMAPLLSKSSIWWCQVTAIHTQWSSKSVIQSGSQTTGGWVNINAWIGWIKRSKRHCGNICMQWKWDLCRTCIASESTRKARVKKIWVDDTKKISFPLCWLRRCFRFFWSLTQQIGFVHPAETTSKGNGPLVVLGV